MAFGFQVGIFDVLQIPECPLNSPWEAGCGKNFKGEPVRWSCAADNDFLLSHLHFALTILTIWPSCSGVSFPMRIFVSASTA